MKRHDIRFLNVLALRGPNIWTYRPVLEAWVDIGDLEECPSNTLPGFVERLCAWLPTLDQHRCSYGEPGGFIKRLQEGTWIGHILEHVTLELQNLAGIRGGFGRARETGVRGIYKVVVEAHQEEVTRACLASARELLLAAIADEPFDLEATHERLRQLVRQHALGPNTACIVNAATAKSRAIPAIRLSAESLVQLGYGSRQRRIWAAETDHTGAIAEGIARRPSLARRLLGSVGLPVADPDEPLANPDSRLHRLLIVGGKMVAAARLESPATGAAKQAADTPDMPALDVTDHVHPATAAAAGLAARVVGLNIAGVDVLAADLARPLAQQDGAITGVHAGPSLLMHLESASGEPRPIGLAIVDYLFPNNDRGRIPVVGITGSNGTTHVARLVAELLRLSGKYTGLACGDGLFLNRRRVETGDRGNWQSATRLLMNRAVDAAVVENQAPVILGQGLAYDRCQVGVVTRIDPPQHLGPYYIHDADHVFRIFRSQIDVVLPDGIAVLDAADPMARELAPLCDGEVIYFASDPSLPLLESHLATGGRAVMLRDGLVTLAAGAEQTMLAPLTGIPFLTSEDSAQRLDSVLAAVAAAWALGIALHVLRTGLETFCPECSDVTDSSPALATLPPSIPA